MDRESLLVEIRQSDSAYFHKIKVYMSIVEPAFMYIYNSSGKNLESFLEYLRDTDLEHDLKELNPPRDRLYTHIEYTMKLASEAMSEPDLAVLNDNAIYALNRYTMDLDYNTICRGILSACVRLVHEYKLSFGDILQYMDLDAFDLYDWKYIENIPRLRQELILEFKQNYNLGAKFDSVKIPIENPNFKRVRD